MLIILFLALTHLVLPNLYESWFYFNYWSLFFITRVSWNFYWSFPTWPLLRLLLKTSCLFFWILLDIRIFYWPNATRSQSSTFFYSALRFAKVYLLSFFSLCISVINFCYLLMSLICFLALSFSVCNFRILAFSYVFWSYATFLETNACIIFVLVVCPYELIPPCKLDIFNVCSDILLPWRLPD